MSNLRTNKHHSHEATPFAQVSNSGRTVSLWMLMFSLTVFAVISLVIMLAARVPIIANSVNDVLGLPRTAKPDKPDRTTHLIFLLFCYSSPLLLAMWVGLLRGLYVRFKKPIDARAHSNEPDNPFA
jgi:hypothetical protein